MGRTTSTSLGLASVAALLSTALLFSTGAWAAETEPDLGSGTGDGSEVDLSDLTDEEREYVLWAASFVDSLEPRHGTIDLADGVARLDLPDDFYYLSPQDSKRVLEEAWGNPPSDLNLGMIFPQAYNPMDPAAWGVAIDFVDDGFISDEDAQEIDFDELLGDMQKAARAENEKRTDAGYEPIELVGWAARPYYDPSSHKLHWAKELRFGEQEENTLNYNIRVLGRRGYLELNFIAAMSQLAEIEANRESVLGLANFEQGHRYQDFDPSSDHVAAYGIGALVAGGILAKSGALAKFLLVFKKLWILLALGVGSLVKRLTGRRDPPTSESDISPT